MISKQLLIRLLEEEHEKYGDEYDWEQIMGDIEDFPDEQEESGEKIEWDLPEVYFTISGNGGGACQHIKTKD